MTEEEKRQDRGKTHLIGGGKREVLQRKGGPLRTMCAHTVSMRVKEGGQKTGKGE